MTSTMTQMRTERVDLGRLWWVGLLAIIASSIANTIVRVIAVALLQPPPEFAPLSWIQPIIFTVVGVLGGVIVFAIFARVSHRPITIFRITALVVMLVSLVPDFLLLVPDPPPFPGITVGTITALSIMHVVAWAITVPLLTTLTRIRD